MTEPLLTIRPGPFIRPFGLNRDLWLSLSLVPLFLWLLCQGSFLWLLAPAAAGAIRLLTGPGRSWSWLLGSLASAVLLGPGPISPAQWPWEALIFFAAGLSAGFCGRFYPSLTSFLPATTMGLAIGSLHFWFVSGSPTNMPFGGPVWPIFLLDLNFSGALWLVPSLLVYLALARPKKAPLLLALLLWTAAALMAANLKTFSPNFIFAAALFIQLTDRSFFTFSDSSGHLSAVLNGLIVAAAGAWPAFSPNFLLLSVLMLTLTEAAATFKSVAPSLAGDAPIPPGDENLVAVRLCDRLGGRPQILASFQAPAICRTAAALSDGPYACPQACLGLGDCARVCPYGALLRPSGAAVDSPPEIDASRCRACGQCLKACPRQLMTLKPRLAPSVVSCRGTARMKEMDRLCASGCLGCGLCRKACPIGAVSRRSRQAPPPVNYQACLTAFPNCGLACQSACPRRLPGPAGVPRPNSQPD